MFNPGNMKIRFKATDEYPHLNSTQPTVQHWTDGKIQVLPGKIAEPLMAAFPDNFEIVEEHDMPAPVANKAQSEPEANKDMPDGGTPVLFVKALAAGIITQAGPWYKFGKTRLGRGKAEAIQYLERHTSTAVEIRKKLE